MQSGDFLILSAALFSIGLVVIITKRNAIAVLMGIELILNAANINLVAFSQNDPALKGQIFAIFTIIVAASEAAVGLGIVLLAYAHFRTTNADEYNQMKD